MIINQVADISNLISYFDSFKLNMFDMPIVEMFEESLDEHDDNHRYGLQAFQYIHG